MLTWKRLLKNWSVYLSEDNIILGTWGWSYKEWEGSFYQKRADKENSALTHVFKTAEIDSTFYRNPTKGTVMGWLSTRLPTLFSRPNCPKLITHDKKLGLKSNVKQDLESS